MSTLSIVVSVFFGSLGALCFVLLPSAIRRQRRMQREGVIVSGTVGERVDHGGDGFCYRVHYQVAGTPYSIVTKDDHGLMPGQVVPIRYQPDRPRRACLEEPSELKNETRGFIVGGVVCWVGVIVAIVLGMTKVF